MLSGDVLISLNYARFPTDFLLTSAQLFFICPEV